MENEIDYYIDHEYDKDYFTTDVEQQYIKETGRMPYKKSSIELLDAFKYWLQKKHIKDEVNDVMLYKKQTGKSAYEEESDTLTKEFNEWYWEKERNQDMDLRLSRGISCVKSSQSVSYWLKNNKEIRENAKL